MKLYNHREREVKQVLNKFYASPMIHMVSFIILIWLPPIGTRLQQQQQLQHYMR